MNEERGCGEQTDWADRWAADYKKELEMRKLIPKTMGRMLAVLGAETRQTMRDMVVSRILRKGKDDQGN